MKRRLLVRFGAILAVVAMIVVSTLGWQPLLVAAGAFGVLAYITPVCSGWARDGPVSKEPAWLRRRRAHEKSQNYLSEIGTAPTWPIIKGGVKPYFRDKVSQLRVCRSTNGASTQNELKRSTFGYRARDQPYGLFRTLIGTHDPIPGVP